MKTKNITYGGLMVALFLALDLIFRTNVRAVQTYLEIVKTIIIAVFIRNMGRNSWWISAAACFLSCMILVSVPNTLIYNVPSIIGGCVIGVQKENKIKSYVVFFVVNSFMIIYEFIMFGFFMKTNLFALYKKQAANILPEITNGIISKTTLQVLFMLFIILDSAVSSLIIFILVRIILKKLNGIKNSN